MEGQSFVELLPLLAPLLLIWLVLLVAGLIDLIRREHTRGPKWIWFLVVICFSRIRRRRGRFGLLSAEGNRRLRRTGRPLGPRRCLDPAEQPAPGGHTGRKARAAGSRSRDLHRRRAQRRLLRIHTDGCRRQGEEPGSRVQAGAGGRRVGRQPRPHGGQHSPRRPPDRGNDGWGVSRRCPDAERTGVDYRVCQLRGRDNGGILSHLRFPDQTTGK